MMRRMGHDRGAAHGVLDGRMRRKKGGFDRCIIIQVFGNGRRDQRVDPP